MSLLSKRQRHALAAGGAATLAYLAAAELGSKKPVRAGGLIMLGMAMMARVSSAGASAKLQQAHARIDAHVAATAPAVNLVANGGTIGGSVTVAGDHHIQGALFGAGGTIQVGDSVAGNGSGRVAFNDSISMGASIVMNGNDAFTFGHVAANQIGPGTTRANLGGTSTLAALTTRSDYHNGVLQNAGICY
jgi:hypothetical protein